jgi:peptidoglycan-N-acetylglucosamine deacetylase
MYPFKTPWLVKKLYPALTWNKDREERCIYLTFDDGPIPIVTPFVLKTLETYQAKATFFCIGDNVQKHPEIYQMVVDGGHSIGNHTFNHLKGWDVQNNTYVENVIKCDGLLHTHLFRPPYGRIKKSQVKMLKAYKPNMEIIMWDVLSGDFDVELEPEKCLKKIKQHAENGSIVVFHDSLKAFPRLEYALPRALQYWSKQGYRFEGL